MLSLQDSHVSLIANIYLEHLHGRTYARLQYCSKNVMVGMMPICAGDPAVCKGSFVFMFPEFYIYKFSFPGSLFNNVIYMAVIFF